MINELAAADLDPVSVRFMFGALVPPAVLLRVIRYRLGFRRTADDVLRRVSRHLGPPPAVERIVKAVLAVESWMQEKIPLPFGLSLIGAFRPRR